MLCRFQQLQNDQVNFSTWISRPLLCLQQENSEQYVCKCNAGFSGVSCKISTNSSTPAVAPTTSTGTTTSTASGTYTCGGTACKNGQCLQQENSDAYYCKCNAGSIPP